MFERMVAARGRLFKFIGRATDCAPTSSTALFFAWDSVMTLSLSMSFHFKRIERRSCLGEEHMLFMCVVANHACPASLAVGFRFWTSAFSKNVPFYPLPTTPYPGLNGLIAHPHGPKPPLHQHQAENMQEKKRPTTAIQMPPFLKPVRQPVPTCSVVNTPTGTSPPTTGTITASPPQPHTYNNFHGSPAATTADTSSC